MCPECSEQKEELFEAVFEDVLCYECVQDIRYEMEKVEAERRKREMRERHQADGLL